jgi:regulator of replication initiation timing
MLRIFNGDLENEFVVRASEKLAAERARLDALKTPKERVQDLEIQLSALRGTVGTTAQDLARAKQQAQEALSRVDRLETELQASLEEVKRLEVQQDQYKAQLSPSPSDRPQAEAETPEERKCADIIAFLMQLGGDTAHVQQTVNEVQDEYLRLSARRTRTQAVKDDSLEHGLPEDPPWQLQEGSSIRESIIMHGSLETQRHVSNMLAQQNAKRTNHKGGKGKGKDIKPDVQAPAASTSVSGASQSDAAAAPRGTPAHVQAESLPPWRDKPLQTSEVKSNSMDDADGPERGAKRPADRSEAPEDSGLGTATPIAEEDEFEEAARYRRGDGHYT